MLNFKGCPGANTYFPYSIQLISDWQGTALRSVIIFPCFLISWMKNLSTRILKLCIELTAKRFLYSFLQCIKREFLLNNLSSLSTSPLRKSITLQDRSLWIIFGEGAFGLLYVFYVLLLKNPIQENSKEGKLRGCLTSSRVL